MPISMEKNLRTKFFFIFAFMLIILFIINTVFSIALLKSDYSFFMGIILIPLLISLLFVLKDRFRNINKIEKTDLSKIGQIKNYSLYCDDDGKFFLYLNYRKYFFSVKSIFLSLILTPLLIWGIIAFFLLEINAWFAESIARQSNFLLNVIFNINSQVIDYPWSIRFGQTGETFIISPWCTSIHVIAIFISIILLIPHSKDISANHDIIWRKAKSLFVLVTTVYILNVIRIVIVIVIANFTLEWDFIHEAINYISAFIAAVLFFIVVQKWTPELFLSIYFFIQYPKMRNQSAS